MRSKAIEMDVDQGMQTFMIVWDINLENTPKVDGIDIVTPLFALDPTEADTKWIRLVKENHTIRFISNFALRTELLAFTAYVIDPAASTCLYIFNGFDMAFEWERHEWSPKMRVVFEAEWLCNASVVQPAIWKRCVTETRPALHTAGMWLNVEASAATHEVVNNRKRSCVVKKFTENAWHKLNIEPKAPTAPEWNLLTVMLRKLENNALEWHHIHTTNNSQCDGRFFKTFQPIIITEIYELSTTLATDMSDMTSVTDIIKPPPPPPPPEALKPLPPLRVAPELADFFSSMKFCDITVHVRDQQVRAHRIILATGSTLCNEHQTTVVINDFNIETVKQLIEYMYTGTVQQPNEAPEQLLRAAHTYGVAGLKELCVEQLCETIHMDNVVNLMVLAEQCKATILFKNVLAFVRDDYAKQLCRIHQIGRSSVRT